MFSRVLLYDQWGTLGMLFTTAGDTSFGSDVLYISFHSSANVSLREALGPGWFIVLSQHGGKPKLGIDSRPAKRVKVGGHRRHPVRLPPVLTRERTGSFLSHGDGVTTAKASGYPHHPQCSLLTQPFSKHEASSSKGERTTERQAVQDFSAPWTHTRAGNRIREAA